MIKTTFHCHSTYSDGRDSIEAMILSAIKQGLTKIGFSDHCPIPIPAASNMDISKCPLYIAEAKDLAFKYRDQIEVYVGLELEYLEDKQDATTLSREGLDFVIGSIHFMKVEENLYLPIDYSSERQQELVNKYFSGNYNEFALKFYKDVIAMINSGTVDFIGHLDLIKKFNKDSKLFNEESPEILAIITEILDLLVERDIGLEINTGAISRGYLTDTYPSLSILKMCAKKGVKITVNSDAHKSDDLLTAYDLADKYLKEAGYKNINNDGIIPFYTV